jgi:diguanylate cyclase
MARLYREFVDPRDPTRLEDAQRAFRALAEKVMSSLDRANGEVSRYEASLQSCSDQLAGDVDAGQLRSLVTALAASTAQVNSGSGELQRNLVESRREAEALREELAKVRTEAMTDALTGLANRKAFDARLAELETSGQRMAGDHCIMIADIDRFKSINDTYGHLFGDRVLRSVGQVLHQLIKGKDLAARFGGEEFIVLLPDTQLEGAMAVAENVRKAIQNGRVINQKTGQEVRKVTVSIGVTQLTRQEPIEDALARADAALYRAKEGGRNRVEIAPLPPSAVAVNAA